MLIKYNARADMYSWICVFKYVEHLLSRAFKKSLLNESRISDYMGQFDAVVTFIVDTFFCTTGLINPYCTHGFGNPYTCKWL